ncbi:MAG TPA: hypothetical protein ENK88_00210 [Campylobacterales bacterium]|nr:hypothetical protein [Arcobacter sp.]HHB93558.1 hypothetical protein [Campylobacterales bacterium]
MKTFIHYKKQRLETLLNNLNELNELYIKRSFSFQETLFNFLQETIEFYEQIGENSSSSKVSQLNIYLETAKKGINPQTLEKLKTGKRENLWIASYHILDELSSLLQNNLLTLELEITQARELVEQVILSAIQSKLITDSNLKELTSQDKIIDLWKNLSKNEQIKLIEKKLKLSITQDDIIILCDLVCSKIRN